jgi:hypothetical protein
MRLLNTTTLKLQQFPDNRLACKEGYAIPSHTWGVEEVTLQQIQNQDGKSQNLAGYQKIRQCCAQARADGFKYTWIDTCCIDKTNSTELSEAINSMFTWYRDAAECYAYLEDVSSEVAFTSSKWFTRGWTLQELIAPPSVVFFNANWEEIGTKSSLRDSISTVTGIPSSILLRQTATLQPCVAQIMSWASKRETTRIEDTAYCLLGLFDVHMPMIYGEGTKAFTRLQLEIMKTSHDQSIFAWRGLRAIRGPLAACPAEFTDCEEVTSKPIANGSALEYTMTNRGLRIWLPFEPFESSP